MIVVDIVLARPDDRSHKRHGRVWVELIFKASVNDEVPDWLLGL